MSLETKNQRHLSQLGAWAFSIGTSIGWGSLVVTSSTYLSEAGPLGSVLGLVLGGVIMLVISRNYEYMMRCFPEEGGAYSYAREVLGYDQGFLVSWFILMTYFAILWANATSLPLFGRIFLGGMFCVGKLYTLFGYDVYFGEALLSIAAILLFGFLATRHKRLVKNLMIALALLFSAGILICFGAAMVHAPVMTPSFVPDSSALSQITRIAIISPWAFIGFESISHRTEEFNFEHSKIHRVLVISVLSALLLYIAVTLLSVTAYPLQYASWLDYIRDLNHLSGIEALPAFYAAGRYLGNFGVVTLMVSLLALIITSLIGNITALSRLLCYMAKDDILPARYAKQNEQGIPANASMLVVAVSCLVPFVGRTAIGWIVDVTTIGAVLIYGMVSGCTMIYAKKMDDRKEMWYGRIGAALMILLGLCFLLPNLVTKGTLATETYFLFIIWSVLGFLVFRNILHHDKKKRFGSSNSVWMAFLTLVLVVALIWMRQSMLVSYDSTMEKFAQYFANTAEATGDAARLEDLAYVAREMELLEASNTRAMIMAVGMFGFALLIMFTNHSYMGRRSREHERIANRDPMTGVMSKHAFLEKEKELNQEISSGQIKDFAIVVCDVNGLKRINDQLGHKAGDEYIRKSCTMICDIFRHSPVYRVGGDEFVAILSGRDFNTRTDLMRSLHDRSVSHIGSQEAVVSGGISVFEAGKDDSAHAVFERADASMYEEKKLLKSLGAVTRDEEPTEEIEELRRLSEQESILDVRRHVLIVEDEEINRDILVETLREDYELYTACDGLEALEVLREHREEIALVMLDLWMPCKSGIEVLETIAEDRDLHRVPVIVLTADQTAELECLRLGAMDFIPKPYPIPEIILARVNKCIELSENRDIIQSTERDSLTKLLNIDYFYRYVKLFDTHYRDRAMDACVFDINNFHLINERYGRSFSDQILKRIGEKIRAAARDLGGVGCRKDKDTFLLYCPHTENYEDLYQRLTSGLLEAENTSSAVRLRLGIYANADKNIDIETRFQRARHAGDSIRGSYVKHISLYDASTDETLQYNERLLEEFRPSLENGRFLVYFQPKYDIRSDTPVLQSAEALARWDHPELGMLGPDVFIPLLEENGLILELDSYIWRKAAEAIREWKDRLGYAIPISVNVSRIDMLNPDLKTVFRSILDDNHLSTADMSLELTESAYTEDTEQVLRTARELRGMGMGFRIEMDDFGTGYSSLSTLSNLPIDALKLDIMFVRTAFKEPRDTRMIELIFDIADYLNVPVVAEGVETEEQYLVLKAMGCEYVQGFYFSKPLPSQEFEQLLQKRGDHSVDLTPAMRNTFMSISKALTGSFEEIYYVDTLTNYYLEFHFDEAGEMQIRPRDRDFFTTVPNEILNGVSDIERKIMEKALQKNNLIIWATKEEASRLRFRRNVNGTVVPYCIQSIPTRANDHSHIMIGVRKETQ